MNINVWNPNPVIKNGLIGKLIGHTYPISKVLNLDWYELISIDKKMIIKIWNIDQLSNI